MSTSSVENTKRNYKVTVEKANGNVAENVTYKPRKLARSVAKANMKRAGMRNINDGFSYNWRNWVRG